jgi:hypothetical protein
MNYKKQEVMKSNTLDKIFKEGLHAGSSPVNPDVWSRLSSELEAEPKKRSKSYRYIALVSAAAILLFLVLLPNSRPNVKSLKIGSQPAFSNLNSNAVPSLLNRAPLGYSKDKEVQLKVVKTLKPPELIINELAITEEFKEDEIIGIKVDALALLNSVESEMSRDKKKIQVLAVNPKTLLEEAERNSKGNQFGKKVLEKVKLGLKEIETRIVKTDDE